MKQIKLQHLTELSQWNSTHQVYPEDNLIQLLEKKAAEYPDNIAYIFQDTAISFAELNQRANQLAHFILSQEKNNPSPIAVYFERSIELVIAFYAVMKLGRPYIPINKEISTLQLKNILKDAKANLILTTDRYAENIRPSLNAISELIVIDAKDKKIQDAADSNLPSFPATATAYILYTSGTTGKPKGVQISHKAITNLLFSMSDITNISEKDVILSITPFTFDLSVPDIYLPLVMGGTSVLGSPMARFNPHEIMQYIAKYHVTLMQATPTTWQMLVACGWKNESDIKIITGGEALTNQLASKLRLLSENVWNFYGPTETTVWSTYHKIEEIDKNKPYIPIGKPLANTQIFVLDEDLNPLSADMPGELYIGGTGVSLGYVNNDELNLNYFIEDPFNSGATKKKLYKTGDLGKWSPQGDLYYLGRIDTQIKLRGYRIEVEAIENVLLDYPGIHECIVHDQTPENTKELVAYITLKTKSISPSKVQEYLKNHFPDHMIPSKFIVVNQFPLTFNGKINRQTISSIREYTNLADEIISLPHQNPVEEIIVEQIKSLVNRDIIDPEINFFNLGFHSLLLIDLAHKLNKTMPQTISVVDLFTYPTVRSLAQFYAQLDDRAYENNLTTPSEKKLETSIALIGMACKLPGANNPNEFWQTILNKQENIHFFNEGELLDAGIPPELINHPDYVPARGVLKNIDQFDASFFGYTPLEAALMDPQHRIFLEQAWIALEDSGYSTDKCKGSIGLFAGMSDSTYLTQNILKNPAYANWDQQQLSLGTSSHYLCTKVAYAMGLTGPVVTVNTACSTSLTSIASACDSLLNHKCDMALAGGITVIVPECSGYLYRDMGILSPNGHCRVFDKESKGTVMSNGCGVVVLKRLADALRDNDNILAVIKGWAINNDGANKTGFTAPSVAGQISCIQDALSNANINPEDISYIEAHGTGTFLGDPIEIEALSKGYSYNSHQKNSYCAIGSIKSNIGHTDVASGIAGFIKLVLALQKKTLPPQIHFSSANERINLNQSPFYVNSEIKSWESKSKRLGAVHSLGFGGTNVHMILEEAPAVKTSESKPGNLFLISAKTPYSLEAIRAKLQDYLENSLTDSDREKSLADIAYTLQVGRKHFKHRMAVTYSDYTDLLKNLVNSSNRSVMHSDASPSNHRIIFGFSGQGSQYVNMALDLYQNQPLFKNIIDESCEKLRNHLNFDLRELLFPKQASSETTEKLNNTLYAQPALFIIEYALAQLLIELGIKPDAMIGHSLGEFVAATLSGIVNLDESLQVIATRAHLMARTKPGALFSEDVLNLKLSANDIFIEIGPGSSLTQLIRQHPFHGEEPKFINTVPSAIQASQNSYLYFLKSLGTLWLLKQEIQWERLYVKEIRKRVPLPTYQFEPQSHWIHPIENQVLGKNNQDKLGLYTPSWKRDATYILNTTRDKSPKTWFIFANEQQPYLEQCIRDAGHFLYTIKSGKEFKQLTDSSFVIDPTQKSHYGKLLGLVKIRGEQGVILHAWLLENGNSKTTLFDGPFSILYLSQLLSELHPKIQFNCLTLASNLYSVFGNEQIIPIKAAVLGPCKVIPLEQENLFCKVIDLDQKEKITAKLANALFHEALDMTRDCAKDEIAYRAENRWIRVLDPCSDYLESLNSPRIKTKGVYLITGGLGGIGLSLAQHLATNYQANIILLSPNLLSLEQDEKLKLLADIRSKAESLTIEQASVENKSRIRGIVKSILEKFGRLDGVIHAAGLAGGGVAQLKTLDEYNRVLEPKLQGTETILKALYDVPLDFIVFLSSTTSILGYPGQIDYCSANRVLDAFANTNPFKHPVFCVSMNWQAWRDVGMAAESETKLFSLNESNSYTAREAVILFEKIVNSDLNQVIISKSDPNKLHISINSLAKDPLPSIESSVDDNGITSLVLQIWRDILGINDIGLDDDFYELGGHSLLAITLLAKIKKQFNTKIPTAALFEAKTIRSLSELIQTYTQQSLSPLVVLKQGKSNNKPPLFIVHPIGGTVFCYLPLVEALNDDRTYYGLQDPSLELEKPLFSNIEEMATAYREAIQKVQPQGPYYLCGASFGATVITEITYQLLELKEEVQFIGLIDGWASFSDKQLASNYVETLQQYHQEHSEIAAIIPPNLENTQLWETMLQHRLDMMRSYPIKKINAKLSLFKASEILPEYQEIDAGDNHWLDYSTSSINCHTIPGNHNSILEKPNVLVLANKMQEYLTVASTPSVIGHPHHPNITRHPERSEGSPE
ncbi:Polyketide synthase PksJ [Legionella massiliensis]|uniref:Polyketide synthase PksJ n=1 Tax=Legionella massiliensis TaxID=1034943 RepID=A0A078L2Z9_9GAMM|nr:type I polyketide synthase [Legionella massiliensis]CDZ78479.1 Polyketide synthase PksJ [Legionella massiliensis]CEE14217.1 Polyketide synthase PksJ [Legionella massiliensis]